MKYLKKYMPVMLSYDEHNNDVHTLLYNGRITGYYDSRESPVVEFDTQDKAVEYAHGQDPYSNWTIIEIISFNNFGE